MAKEPRLNYTFRLQKKLIEFVRERGKGFYIQQLIKREYEREKSENEDQFFKPSNELSEALELLHNIASKLNINEAKNEIL